MRAVLEWFESEHGPRRIVCMVSVGNHASLALAAKLGFTPLRQAELPDGDTVQLLERTATRLASGPCRRSSLGLADRRRPARD
jgi:RimJ/RimL family protein N-acetyltransferase